jgi:hypothetical protein
MRHQARMSGRANIDQTERNHRQGWCLTHQLEAEG